MLSTITAGVPERCRPRKGARRRAYKSWLPPGLTPTMIRRVRRSLTVDGPGEEQEAAAATRHAGMITRKTHFRASVLKSVRIQQAVSTGAAIDCEKPFDVAKTQDTVLVHSCYAS